VALYPGATAATLPAAAGSPPPGANAYNTADSFAKVKAWYQANVPAARLTGSTPTGAAFLIGDAKTGSIVLIQEDHNKTWILTGPASALNGAH